MGAPQIIAESLEELMNDLNEHRRAHQRPHIIRATNASMSSAPPMKMSAVVIAAMA